MITNQEIKLQKPEQYYGAVYGRGNHKQIWLYIAFVCTIIFCSTTTILLVMALIPPISILGGISMALIMISVIIPFFVGVITFTYNSGNFTDDIKQGRTKYAHTEFKTWVEQKYGVQITEEQALNLMNGANVAIQLTDSKEKSVRFKETEGMSKLFKIGRTNYANFQQAKTWDYDTDKLDFQLLINKKQKPVKEKTWN